MTESASTEAISYPFATTPDFGTVLEVADGVYWLRMPLPFRLDHINLYLLRDRDGWIIVDTGIRGEQVLACWNRVFDEVIGDAPVHRIIATHMHPDHVGQVGWLTRHCNAEVWMSRTEFLMCRLIAADGPADVPEDAIRFYRHAGFNERQLDLYQQRFGRFGAMIERLPAGYRRLRDADQLDIDGRMWEVVVGRGHSPEHVCLHCAELGVLISGDQCLPRISSNVSVFPTEPEGDPLCDWIESCHALRRRLPAETLVLPAHNEPFHGLHTRLGALVEGHAEGLTRLFDLCAEPSRVVDVFPALFRATITDENLLLATGESRAHINYLTARGALDRTTDADGAWRYRQAAGFDPATLSRI